MGVLGAVGRQFVRLVHHATPPAEAEILCARFTDWPSAIVTSLNESREGEVKVGWPRLGLWFHDNYMRNFAIGREGHVIPLHSCHRRSVRYRAAFSQKKIANS
jgi:hypothetical protein